MWSSLVPRLASYFLKWRYNYLSLKKACSWHVWSSIGHFCNDDISLPLPEFISFLLSCLNLSLSAYHLYGNPEIPGRIQMERFIPVEIFRKKKYWLSRYYLPPVFTEMTEIFCTIVWITSARREKAKNLPAFCKRFKSIPFLFSVPKTMSVPSDGNFSQKFPYKWQALKYLPLRFIKQWP